MSSLPGAARRLESGAHRRQPPRARRPCWAGNRCAPAGGLPSWCWRVPTGTAEDSGLSILSVAISLPGGGLEYCLDFRSRNPWQEPSGHSRRPPGSGCTEVRLSKASRICRPVSVSSFRPQPARTSSPSEYGKRSNQSGKASTSRDIDNSSIPDPISNRFQTFARSREAIEQARFRAVTSRRHDLEQDLTSIHNWTGIDVEVLPVYPAKDIGGTTAKNLPHRCGWAVAPPFQFD